MSPKRGAVKEPLIVEPPLLDEDQTQMPVLAAFAETFGDELTPEAKAELDEAMAFVAPERVPHRGLHAKLAEVMAIAERIPKRGVADKAMGGYPFVQVGDAADFLRPELAKRQITMLPVSIEQVGELETRPTRSGGTTNIQTVKQTWQLTDAETGEFIHIESFGTGGDTGDKFSPKAQTNAMKYAILMGFMLSTGDDPEAAKAEPDQGPGVQITGSNIPGVLMGGRQRQATTAQLDAIRKRAGELELTPESLATLIGASLGGHAPDIDSLETNSDRTTAIIDFLGSLSFADCGTVVKAILEIELPGVASPSTT